MWGKGARPICAKTSNISHISLSRCQANLRREEPLEVRLEISPELGNILFLVSRGQIQPAVSIPKAKRPSLFPEEQPEEPGGEAALPGLLYLR